MTYPMVLRAVRDLGCTKVLPRDNHFPMALATLLADCEDAESKGKFRMEGWSITLHCPPGHLPKRNAIYVLNNGVLIETATGEGST